MKYKNYIFNKKVIVYCLLLLLVLGGYFAYRYYRSPETKLTEQKSELPPEISQGTDVGRNAQGADDGLDSWSGAKQSIPEELNLSVPFTSQAPNAIWDKAHEEACEEAAALMAEKYFQGGKFASADDAEAGLQQIISWEMKNFGFFESTTAAQTAQIVKAANLKTEIIDNPTVDQIKTALSENKLVIMPEAGQLLGNPFYTAPGPIYHMLLIKGYTKTQFITNDAGTKRGENYPYDFATVLKANHDFDAGNILNGAKKLIIISN